MRAMRRAVRRTVRRAVAVIRGGGLTAASVRGAAMAMSPMTAIQGVFCTA